jgi:hypothetical protein
MLSGDPPVASINAGNTIAHSRFRRRISAHMENHVLKQIVAVLTLNLATAAMAEGPTCNAAAAEKKLAGAATAALLTKCEKDATATCQGVSKETKLSGAAKTSFEKKFVKDAVGEPAPAK